MTIERSSQATHNTAHTSVMFKRLLEDSDDELDAPVGPQNPQLSINLGSSLPPPTGMPSHGHTPVPPARMLLISVGDQHSPIALGVTSYTQLLFLSRPPASSVWTVPVHGWTCGKRCRADSPAQLRGSPATAMAARTMAADGKRWQIPGHT